MVRKYKRKTNNPPIEESKMKKAISDILNKRESCTSASRKYGIKRTTLITRINAQKKKNINNTALDSGNSECDTNEYRYQSKYTSRQVFTSGQEVELASYFVKCSRLQFGMSFLMARKFVFQYAKIIGGQTPPSWGQNNSAGIDWLKGFMNRNVSVSLRKPESTSLSRINGFTKRALEEFHTNLEKVYRKHNFSPKDIYNLDETAVSTVMDAPKGTPTVLPASNFEAMRDATELRKAMRGFGTDEDALINIICRRNNAQRQEIVNVFKTHYGKNLIEEIISETSGNFQKVLIGLLMPTVDYYIKELADAMAGRGTDEDVLIEIMCTLANREIHAIKEAYKRTYGRDLEADLVAETSGNFKRLLVSLSTGNRDESGVVDQASAAIDAQELLEAGELCFGTDESTFNMVLCQRNFKQLKLVFEEYQNLTGHSLEKAIKKEFSGDIEEGLLAIYKCVMDKAEFFAEKLHTSMAGLGTDDQQLIRILICRCEIDLEDIKKAFEKRYGSSLRSWIKDDTSGDYKHALYALIGEECSSK